MAEMWVILWSLQLRLGIGGSVVGTVRGSTVYK